MIQIVEKFKGLYTEADEYSTQGTLDCLNVDIDENNDLIKAKGYERVEPPLVYSEDISNQILNNLVVNGDCETVLPTIDDFGTGRDEKTVISSDFSFSGSNSLKCINNTYHHHDDVYYLLEHTQNIIQNGMFRCEFMLYIPGSGRADNFEVSLGNWADYLPNRETVYVNIQNILGAWQKIVIEKPVMTGSTYVDVLINQKAFLENDPITGLPIYFENNGFYLDDIIAGYTSSSDDTVIVLAPGHGIADGDCILLQCDSVNYRVQENNNNMLDITSCVGLINRNLFGTIYAKIKATHSDSLGHAIVSFNLYSNISYISYLSLVIINNKLSAAAVNCDFGSFFTLWEITTVSDIDLDEDIEVMLTQDGYQPKLFINGSEAATVLTSYNSSTKSNWFYHLNITTAHLGFSTDSIGRAENNFIGTIYELNIYNKPKYPSEIGVDDSGLMYQYTIPSLSPLKVNNTLAGKVWKAEDVTPTSITIKNCSIYEDNISPTIVIDKTFCGLSSLLFDSIGLNPGDSLSVLNTYGHHTDDVYFYAFIGIPGEQYLCRSSVDTIFWEPVEETPTKFSDDYKAWFVNYENKTIFVKNESKTIDTDTGGVFYIDNDSIKLYGTVNNPTPAVVSIHKERIWTGALKAISSGSVTGSSWCMVSKLFPALSDTTWCDETTAYDDTATGAGIFKCDDNARDSILQLCPGLGFIIILRRYNHYFFTGAIESGDATLAKRLNTPFGALSSNICYTADGIWFVSPYGLAKIEGVAIKTTKTEFDNIKSITYSYPIDSLFKDINEKNKIILYSFDRWIVLHDPNSSKTFSMNTINGEWTVHAGKLIEGMLLIDDKSYSIYKGFVFKMQTGNVYYDFNTFKTDIMESYYETNIMDQGEPDKLKDYQKLYALMKGSVSDSTTVIMQLLVLFNGSRSAAKTINFDIKTGTRKTWQEITRGQSLHWHEITANHTLRWRDLFGVMGKMLEKVNYYLGTARNIKLRFVHKDDSDFRISKVCITYDLLDVESI